MNSNDIKKFVSYIRQKKTKKNKEFAESYVQRIFDIVVYSLNYAIKGELIKVNPTNKIDRPKRVKRKLSIWTVEKFKVFWIL